MNKQNCLSCIKNSEKGVVLLLVLWVITIMLSIILSFSFMSRTEVLSTFSFTDGIKRDFLAEGAISRAVVEMIYAEEHIDDSLVDYEELWKADGTVYDGQLASGKYKVKITSELGKINLNDEKAVKILLRNILLNKQVAQEDVDIIIDSILDWRDKDELHRMNGAETDYYKALEPPYKAKNTNFELIEELLFVKGITEELFYGSKEEGRGLKDLVTVYTEKNQIDINYAPEEVLRAFPNISDEIVDEILTKRKEEKLEGDVDLEGSIASDFVGSDSENKIFTIEAVGITERGLSRYGIKAVVKVTDDMLYTYKYWKNQSVVDITEEETDLKEEKKNLFED